ncbi:MAG: S8 family serine peptidase [Planctomycetes bacterium]|nr:S8 family serine peptidase [Planctomycetota bacterium]
MMRRLWILLAALPLLALPFLMPTETPAQKGKPGKPVEIVFDERAGRTIVKGQLLVTLHEGVTIDDLKPIFERMEAKYEVVGRIEKLNHYTLATDHERLPEIKQRLENHPYVATSAFNDVTEIERIFNDPVFKKPDDKKEDKDNWNLYRINCPDAWDVTTGGSLVGIIDSGAMLDHEELVGRTSNPYSFATNSATMQEGVKKVKRGEKKYMQDEVRNHGTHVAVTIGGAADNGVGTAGVAPRSPLMPLQAIFYVDAFPTEQAGYITATGDSIQKALAMAMDRQASVINMSLGGYNDALVKQWRSAKTELEKEDIAKQLLTYAEDRAKGVASLMDRANRTGVIVVNSAGNLNIPAEFGYLTYTRRTISTAATTRDDTRAIFSNYGEVTTVSAPGHEIWSGIAEPGKPYAYLSGTSMAAPHATGVVSLMQSIDPTLKHADVADILIKTGRPLETDVPIGPLLNAKAAVDETKRRKKEMLKMPEPPPLIPQPQINPTQPGLPDDPVKILAGPAPWNDPNIQRIIRVWLAFAIARPPAGTDPDVRWFFNRNGQPVNNQNILLVQRPVWFQFNFRMLWENANRLESLNMGTLFEFTAGTLRLGKFDPAPTRVPERVRPKKDDNLPRPKGLPFDAGLGKTKWEGKNAKGEPVQFDFNDKGGATITRDGKTTPYIVKINAYAQPMTITFFPQAGGDPIRALLNLTDIGKISLVTDFTKKSPSKLTANDHTFGLKRTDIAGAAAKQLGFAQADGQEIDPRFGDAIVSDGTTDCAGDCGKFAGNNASAGPNTALASLKLNKSVPVVGHSWVIRKFTDTAGPRAYVAKLAKDSRFTTKTFANGMAGFIVKSRSVGADHAKDTIETYAKVGKPFENSSHINTFVYRGTFLVAYTLWEPRRGHDFSAESARIEARCKKLIDERFPPD